VPPPPQARLWLLAAGSGITPMMALVRQLAGQGMPADLALTYWVRRREEACFLDELRALAAQHPRFRLRLMLTREGAIADDEGEGRLCEGHLEGMLADALAAQQVMACGPGGFVETARTLLAGRTASFQAEAFTPPPVTVVDEGEVEVRLLRSGRTLRLPRGQSLLTALEAQGLKPASGCRMGICNTCACGKRQGITRDIQTNARSAEPDATVRICINAAASDLTLDL